MTFNEQLERYECLQEYRRSLRQEEEDEEEEDTRHERRLTMKTWCDLYDKKIEDIYEPFCVGHPGACYLCKYFIMGVK